MGYEKERVDPIAVGQADRRILDSDGDVEIGRPLRRRKNVVAAHDGGVWALEVARVTTGDGLGLLGNRRRLVKGSEDPNNRENKFLNQLTHPFSINFQIN